jgi:type IV secretory pathway ATPase VirB11/archaellum biosynthesis ATPase
MDLIIKGNTLTFDCTNSPYEFMSPDFLSAHLKSMITLTRTDFEKIRYEEQLVFELDGVKAKVILSYIRFLKQVEKLMLKDSIYGREDDDSYALRKRTLQKIFEELIMNPLVAEQTINDYKEPQPSKAVYYEAYKKYQTWLNGILKGLKTNKMYLLIKKKGDMRQAFIYMLNMKMMKLVDGLELLLPEGSKLKDHEMAQYDLDYGYKISIYDVPNYESYWYIIENPIIDSIDEEIIKQAKKLIAREMSLISSIQVKDFNLLFDIKTREYRKHFLEFSNKNDVELNMEQALALGRACASWVCGLGEPMEAISLDKRFITDLYLDAENSPIYLEHSVFGVCHTVYRYNSRLVDQMFGNILASEPSVTFSNNNPIVDLVLKRLNMRCHLQGPPATFGERQSALRLMKQTPFTYAEYLNYRSFSAFFAGYDDMMVFLGSSEAILGLKGVGKTSFTAAKVVSIGAKTRIIPIQDIEEIPVMAYRKRGFHIGVMRSMASDREIEEAGSALSLVALTSATLRMGDAALIINEVRSRAAIQGIINLLNTQPGVFVLYNLHAQSLKDIRDRFELVFGIPAASMFATDRYSFLRKIKFGRKSQTYRLLGMCYESNIEEKKFEEIFRFDRGENIDDSVCKVLFLDNPELNKWTLEDLDLAELSKTLKIKFVPPALKRRSEERGTSPKQMVLQAAFKGKVYSQILKSFKETNYYDLLEMDFVIKVSSEANKLIKKTEDDKGIIDFSKVDKAWPTIYEKLLKEEVSLLKRKKMQDEEEEIKVEEE